MSKLYIRPIDPSAPGSFAEQLRVLQLGVDLQDAMEHRDLRRMLTAMQAARSFVRDRAQAVDGDVDELIEQVSVDEFMAIFAQIRGDAAVDPPSGEPSTPPPLASETTPSRGG